MQLNISNESFQHTSVLIRNMLNPKTEITLKEHVNSAEELTHTVQMRLFLLYLFKKNTTV